MYDSIVSELKKQTLWLMKYDEIFRFVSVGGSVGRTKRVSDNDIDFFIHCTDEKLGKAKRTLEKEIACQHTESDLFGSPELVDGFGIRFGVFSRNSGDIDYFLVSPALVGDFEDFSHHLLIHGAADDFMEFVNHDYRRSPFAREQLLDISRLKFRILHYCKRLTRSYSKGQYFETQRSALALRAIAYGIKKNCREGLHFDWFSCNLLDDRVPWDEFSYFIQTDHSVWPSAIPRIIDHFIMMIERQNTYNIMSLQNAIDELERLKAVLK